MGRHRWTRPAPDVTAAWIGRAGLLRIAVSIGTARAIETIRIATRLGQRTRYERSRGGEPWDAVTTGRRTAPSRDATTARQDVRQREAEVSRVGPTRLAARDVTARQPRQRPTRRQAEVLRVYVATGSVLAAARDLGIAETTVRQHLSGLYRRTGCANAAQAAYLLGQADGPSSGEDQGPMRRE